MAEPTDQTNRSKPDRPPDDLSPWWICVRPLPHDVPSAVRMRRALKCLLRSYSLKCEAIRGKPPDE